MLRFLSLLLLIPCLCFAKLTATVSSRSLELGDTLTLILTTDQVSDYSEPDTSLLSIDFDVLGTSQSTSYSSINGKSENTKSWRISLSPKKTGELIIPEITRGSERTQTITVTIYPAGSHSEHSPTHKIFSKVDAIPGLPYLGEQVLYTIKTYIPADVKTDNLNLAPPNTKQSHIVQLDKDLRYKAVVHGISYQVLERRFAIFPEASGDITIDGAVLSGSKFIAKTNDPLSVFNDPFFNSILFQESEAFRIPVEPITIRVSKKPADYPQAAAWLPSKKLTLKEQWSDKPVQIKVGDPITRTINMTAEGLTAEQLPSIDSQQHAGLKGYPNQPHLSNVTSVDGVTGTRSEEIAYIADKAGEFKLPAVDLLWFNIATHRTEVASLPERLLTVIPANAIPASPHLANPQTPRVGSSESKTAAPNITTDSSYLKQVQAFIKTYLPWLIAAIFFLLWLVTLLTKINLTNNTKKTSANNILQQKHVSNIKQVKQAALQNNPHETARQLLSYINLVSPNTAPNSLTGLIRHISITDVVANKLLELDKAIYYPNQAASWSGEQFYLTCKDWLMQLDQPQNTSKKQAIGPLNF